MTTTRSPIRDHERGLRQPGESAWRQFYHEAFGDFAMHWGLGCGIATGALCLMFAWGFGRLFPSPFVTTPAIAAVLFLVGVIYAYLGYRKFLTQRTWRDGAEGERAVGRVLEELRAHGWYVFHDVRPRESEAWNIDHVLVGPGGIFAVETKTWSKPTDEDTQLVWDGTTLARLFKKSGKRQPDEHGAEAVEQAARNARTLAEVLQNQTHARWHVGAALVFPGWFVKNDAPKPGPPGSVLVLNPKMLASHCRNLPQRLKPEEVALAKARLEGMRVVG